MRLVITGTTGYIGGRLALRASKGGHEVVAATRRPVAPALCRMPFELFSTEAIVLPLETNAVIHLAAATSPAAGLDAELEVLAARSLIAATQQLAAKFVFVSSQTARPDAPTVYGRTKWRIEQEVLAVGGWVVRPGQVYGGCERGLFGKLVGAVRRLPVIFAFLPAPQVQPIHVDDLAEGLLRLVERDDIPPGVFCLAASAPVSFTRFMLAIASGRVRRLRWLVPVPVMLIQVVSGVLGRRLWIRLGLDRLNSLFELPLMDTVNDLQRLGLSLRSLPSGMHPSGGDRRRRLICEGQALLTYLLKERPGASLLLRYVRAVEKLRGGPPLDLPAWALRLPMALALLDDRAFALSAWGAEFAWRLDAATTLAEATTQGARRFLGFGRSSGAVMSLISISRAVVAEIVWRVLRIAGAPFLQRYIRDTGSQR